jgi:serine/threonine protein phosphatase PrpC
MSEGVLGGRSVIMRGKMDCHGLTDIGRARENNEDQFLIADLNKSMLVHQTSLNLEDHTRLFGPSQGQLLLVADGMGGQAAGERASRLAVDTLARYVLHTVPWFLRLDPAREDDLIEELKSALDRCEERIETEAAAHAARRGMGTTLTLAYLLWPRLYVVHAGDSRCYLLRGGRLEQVTTDHTVAQQMIERGMMEARDASGSRWSHVLWNCLGGGAREVRPEVRKVVLQVGDSLLLCTDGLSGTVPEERIRELLSEGHNAEATCRRLVEAANRAGGPDNITVVVAHFRDAQHPLAAQAHTAEAEAPAEPAAAVAPTPALAPAS